MRHYKILFFYLISLLLKQPEKVCQNIMSYFIILVI